jgi:hypothetical protein
MKKFFIVAARCGHVGQGHYIKLSFPICAIDEETAAVIARGRGGVKHHHQNAIISVKEVTFEEYLERQKILYRDPYWQNPENYRDVLGDRILREPSYRPIRFLKGRKDAQRYRYERGQKQLERSQREFEAAVEELR